MDSFLLRLPKSVSKKRNLDQILSKNAPSFDGSSKNAKKPTKSTQLFLDLGQKVFGNSQECKKCGLVYTIDDLEDISRHKQYCIEIAQAPVLSCAIPKECIIHQFNENNSIISLSSVTKVQQTGKKLRKDIMAKLVPWILKDLGTDESFLNTILSHDDSHDKENQLQHSSSCDGTIIAITPTLSSSAAQDGLGTSIMQSELSVHLGIRQAGKSSVTKNNNINRIKSTNSKVLIYLRQKKIVGCIMVEEVFADRIRMVQSVDDISLVTTNNTTAAVSIGNQIGQQQTSSHVLSPSTSGASNEDRPKAALFMGIHILWVHESQRKQQIGHHLVDIARRTFLYSQVMDINQIAFSQPTSIGLQFAKKYCNMEKIACY